ncbi:MAG: amidase [bacterium]|nr:amidase [bacterium]
MNADEIAWLGIDELQLAIAQAEFGAREVTEAALARIDRLDPTLAAFSALWPERARQAAARLDAAQKSGEPLGALQGVPVAVKDLCDVAGEPTRAGTTALGELPAVENAEVVDRLEAAGAVILGKVKMTEGAFVMHHESVTPPKNPWNADRWTGISSSGSGVSVAAGLCTAALGTDTGGSIRYPSAACGLTGLKPTHGRVSLRGVYPLADSLDHIGPMTRSATDTARIFSVLCGYDPRDPWSLAHNPSAATASALLRSVRGTKVGFDVRYCEEGVDASISRALHGVLDVLRGLGVEVVEFSLPSIDEAIGVWFSLGSAEIANAHADTYPSKKDQYSAALAQAIETGRVVSGRDVAHAWKTRIAFTRRLEGCFEAGGETCPASAPEGLDAILAPVIPGLFAADTNLLDADAGPEVAASVRFTSPFNLSGSPSLTMPGGFDVEGAPIGFQLVGAHRAESKLLAIGAAYQAATDYHSRRPSL